MQLTINMLLSVLVLLVSAPVYLSLTIVIANTQGNSGMLQRLLTFGDFVMIQESGQPGLFKTVTAQTGLRSTEIKIGREKNQYLVGIYSPSLLNRRTSMMMYFRKFNTPAYTFLESLGVLSDPNSHTNRPLVYYRTTDGKIYFNIHSPSMGTNSAHRQQIEQVLTGVNLISGKKIIGGDFNYDGWSGVFVENVILPETRTQQSGGVLDYMFAFGYSDTAKPVWIASFACSSDHLAQVYHIKDEDDIDTVMTNIGKVPANCRRRRSLNVDQYRIIRLAVDGAYFLTVCDLNTIFWVPYQVENCLYINIHHRIIFSCGDDDITKIEINYSTVSDTLSDRVFIYHGQVGWGVDPKNNVKLFSIVEDENDNQKDYDQEDDESDNQKDYDQEDDDIAGDEEVIDGIIYADATTGTLIADGDVVETVGLTAVGGAIITLSVLLDGNTTDPTVFKNIGTNETVFNTTKVILIHSNHTKKVLEKQYCFNITYAENFQFDNGEMVLRTQSVLKCSNITATSDTGDLLLLSDTCYHGFTAVGHFNRTLATRQIKKIYDHCH